VSYVVFDEAARQHILTSASIDADVLLLLDYFACKQKSKVLVVGAHDENTANVLSSMELEVYGVDLRDYDPKLPPCNYHYLRGDFCNLPREFINEHLGTFDCVVALSCIEHFGMSAYQEGRVHANYDIIAMRKVWEFLKVGGRAYVTVPFGSHYLEVWPHWRIYNLESAMTRLVQDFNILKIISVSAGEFQIDGRIIKAYDTLTQEDVSVHPSIPPFISTLLVLEKQDMVRLAPDNR
jgi:hypothetical protein